MLIKLTTIRFASRVFAFSGKRFRLRKKKSDKNVQRDKIYSFEMSPAIDNALYQSSGVNFTKTKSAAFLYIIAFQNFSLLSVFICNFLLKKLHVQCWWHWLQHVNFIIIWSAAFSYARAQQCFARSFSLLTVVFVIFLSTDYWRKTRL